MLLHFTKRMLLALLGGNLFLLTLTGCADVPDEVKNDMNSYHDAEGEKSDNAEFEYVEVGALGDEVATALSKDYGQFTISDKGYTQKKFVICHKLLHSDLCIVTKFWDFKNFLSQNTQEQSLPYRGVEIMEDRRAGKGKSRLCTKINRIDKAADGCYNENIET